MLLRPGVVASVGDPAGVASAAETALVPGGTGPKSGWDRQWKAQGTALFLVPFFNSISQQWCHFLCQGNGTGYTYV